MTCESDLQDVLSRRDVSDVNPLTVDISIVGVIATWTQTLLEKQREKNSTLTQSCELNINIHNTILRHFC